MIVGVMMSHEPSYTAHRRVAASRLFGGRGRGRGVEFAGRTGSLFCLPKLLFDVLRPLKRLGLRTPDMLLGCRGAGIARHQAQYETHSQTCPAQSHARYADPVGFFHRADSPSTPRRRPCLTSCASPGVSSRLAATGPQQEYGLRR